MFHRREKKAPQYHSHNDTGKATFPSFAKEGWTRPKEKAAKHPLIGADGGAERASPIGRSNKE